MANVEQQEEHMRVLHKLFEDSIYSDITVFCDSDEYLLHRAIICLRSDFFAKACNNPFKEGLTNEIHLDGDDRQAVRSMIHYFYHLDYPHVEPDVKKDEDLSLAEAEVLARLQAEQVADRVDYEEKLLLWQEWEALKSQRAKKSWLRSHRNVPVKPAMPAFMDKAPNLIIHGRIYALGEKYGISALKKLAAAKFEGDAMKHWDTEEFCQAAEEVYTNTIDSDGGLRSIVVKTICEHKQLVDKSYVQDIIKSHDLGLDLVVALFEKLSPPEEYVAESEEDWDI